MDMENVMNVLLDKPFDEDSETYFIVIEAEEYWNSPRVIFTSLIICVIFSSLALVMIITPFIISSLLKQTKNAEIYRKVSENFSFNILKRVFFGELHAKNKEEDDLEDTSSTGEEIIEWREQERPTMVEEMEWRGLSNQATIYRQRGTKVSPPGSWVSTGVRFFMVEEEGEVVNRISLDEEEMEENVQQIRNI